MGRHIVPASVLAGVVAILSYGFASTRQSIMAGPRIRCAAASARAVVRAAPAAACACCFPVRGLLRGRVWRIPDDDGAEHGAARRFATAFRGGETVD